MLPLLVKRLFCNFTTKLSNLLKLSNLDQNYDVGKLTNHGPKKFIRRLFVTCYFLLLCYISKTLCYFDNSSQRFCNSISLISAFALKIFFVRSKRKIPGNAGDEKNLLSGDRKFIIFNQFN